MLHAETVAGRRCTLVRTGSPMGEALKAPTGRNHTDLCVDGNGIMLRYAWTLNGKLTQTMRATAVDLHPDIGSTTFAALPLASDKTPVVGQVLSDDARARLSPRVAPPPDLRYVTGWVRVEQQQQGVPRITSIELFLRDDIDLVRVEYDQGQHTPEGTRVDLGHGHIAYLGLSLDESRLSVSAGQGASVVIRGADPDLLVQTGRALVFA